jgi:hypothetical protein
VWPYRRLRGENEVAPALVPPSLDQASVSFMPREATPA